MKEFKQTTARGRPSDGPDVFDRSSDRLSLRPPPGTSQVPSGPTAVSPPEVFLAPLGASRLGTHER